MCQFILAVFSFSLVLLGHFTASTSTNSTDYEKNIFFVFYANNTQTIYQTSFTNNLTEIDGCSTDEPWVIIVHGLHEKCAVSWVNEMAANFTKYRGGCIACMDYSYYAFGPYYKLLTIYIDLMKHFNPIADILTRTVEQFVSQGFQYKLGMLFGFSFGGQIVLEAGRATNGSLAKLDACDPAGPLFYPPSPFFPNKPQDSEAAGNVQCIHTSGDYGTMRRDCDQDWEMGDCGVYQNSAKFPGFYSAVVAPYFPFNHMSCPQLYNSAFEHNFVAIDNQCCMSNRKANVSELPPGYKMGYMQQNIGVVQNKTLFALTTEHYPYNVPVAASNTTS